MVFQGIWCTKEVDQDNIKRLLKGCFPEAAIVYTDHSKLEEKSGKVKPFYDQVMEITADKKVEITREEDLRG